MAKSHATFMDDCQSLLGGNTTDFSDAYLTLRIAEISNEIAHSVPHIVKETFQIESRYGTANTDTANALVDSTKAQFLSTDTGKVVYNSDDKTWAIVTAYVSTSQLTLSGDIFPDGNENYKIFNKGCKDARQINIEDLKNDYLWVHKLEYPIGTERNVDSIDGDILTIGIDFTPNDTDPENTDADRYVDIYFAKRHLISQLTDFAGAVNNAGGYAAASTSMAVNGLQASGTIEAGQEFTVVGIRGLYRVTADATISTNAATITFFPGLETAAENADEVTFIQSTLPTFLETLFIDLLAARSALGISTKYIGTLSVGALNTWQQYLAWQQQQLALTLRKLAKESEKYRRPYKIHART